MSEADEIEAGVLQAQEKFVEIMGRFNLPTDINDVTAETVIMFTQESRSFTFTRFYGLKVTIPADVRLALEQEVVPLLKNPATFEDKVFATGKEVVEHVRSVGLLTTLNL